MADEVRSTSQLGRSRIGILGVIVLIIGLNVCIGLIFFALAGGGGPDGWEGALFGTGILMILTGMGILFSYLIFHLTGTRSEE